jgi:hypothetical protein
MTDGVNNWCLVDGATGRPERKYVSHAAPVTCVAVTANGRQALTGSEDKTLRLWDLETGKVLAVCARHGHAVVDVAVSADGRRALSTDGSDHALLWGLNNIPTITPVRTGRPVTAVALSADGSRAALGTAAAEEGAGHDILVFDAASGARLRTYQGHADTITSLAFSPDGKRLVSAGNDRSVRFWSLSMDGPQAATQNLPGSVVRVGFLPGGDKVLVETKTRGMVLSASTQALLGARRRQGSTAVCFSVDELHQTIWSYNVEPGRSILRIGSSIRQEVAQRPPTPTSPPPTSKPAPKVGRKPRPEVDVIARIKERAEDLDRKVKQGRTAFRSPAAAVHQALDLLEEAKAAEDYALAAQIADTAQWAANKWKVLELVKRVADARKEVEAAGTEFHQVKKCIELLATDPDNPEANLAVGRFRCCFEDKWAEGLPLLARGSDKGLQAAAAKDMQDADTPAGCRQIGDLWYKQAERSFPVPIQPALRRRAVLWYQQAYADPGQKMPADVKGRIDKAVNKMEDLAPWAAVDAAEADWQSDCFHLKPYSAMRTRREYRGGIDVTVVARTEEGSIRLAAGDGALAVFNCEEGGLRLHRPDAAGSADGKGMKGGSPVEPANPKVVLEPKKWYTLRWKLTPAGMKVWVGGELVFSKEEAFDLSFASPVAVCSYDGPIEVKAIIVKGVGAPPVAGASP